MLSKTSNMLKVNLRKLLLFVGHPHAEVTSVSEGLRELRTDNDRDTQAPKGDISGLQSPSQGGHQDDVDSLEFGVEPSLFTLFDALGGQRGINIFVIKENFLVELVFSLKLEICLMRLELVVGVLSFVECGSGVAKAENIFLVGRFKLSLFHCILRLLIWGLICSYKYYNFRYF
jgi:hypothetical protein